MNFGKIGIGWLWAMGLFLSLGPTWADQEELQLGYVFDSWSSNSLYHGTEQQVPLGYYFSSPNFSLSLTTAFVAGDYVEDSDATYGIAGSEFKSSQFSDTDLGVNWALDMGNSWRSSLYGTLNFPTGNQSWEIEEQTGAIPYIFEPSYYHGGGWGGNLFYTISRTTNDLSYGIGGGFMSTSVYDLTLSPEGTFSPGDNVVALATLGFRMSSADTWGFRLVHTFPLESTYADPSEDFTEGAGTIFTSQWISQMGKDKLVVNVSYSFYDEGSTAQPTAPYTLVQDPGTYFGDRLEIHPILGYSVGPGVVLETGLIWDWIQPNGYAPSELLSTTNEYEGGGNLLGAEQGITFQLSPSTFWNIAGLYHYIANNNAGQNNQTITYQWFTLGTNVGIKW
jgi:hypothetical protein